MAAKKYTALVGFNLPSGDRVNVGDQVMLEDDAAGILVAEGVIEHISETHKRPDDGAGIEPPVSEPPVVEVTE